MNSSQLLSSYFVSVLLPLRFAMPAHLRDIWPVSDHDNKKPHMAVFQRIFYAQYGVGRGVVSQRAIKSGNDQFHQLHVTVNSGTFFTVRGGWLVGR